MMTSSSKVSNWRLARSFKVSLCLASDVGSSTMYVKLFTPEWPAFSTCFTFWGAVSLFGELFHIFRTLCHKFWNVPLCVSLLGYCPNKSLFLFPLPQVRFRLQSFLWLAHSNVLIVCWCNHDQKWTVEESWRVSLLNVKVHWGPKWNSLFMIIPF